MNVGEILCWIAIKVTMCIAEKGVKKVAGSLEVRSGLEAGSQAGIHEIYDVYQQDETEVVFLVNVDNAHQQEDDAE